MLSFLYVLQIFLVKMFSDIIINIEHVNLDKIRKESAVM